MGDLDLVEDGLDVRSITTAAVLLAGVGAMASEEFTGSSAKSKGRPDCTLLLVMTPGGLRIILNKLSNQLT